MAHCYNVNDFYITRHRRWKYPELQKKNSVSNSVDHFYLYKSNAADLMFISWVL